MKTLNKSTEGRFQTNDVRKEKWIKHYQKLWCDKNAEEEKINKADTKRLDDIILEELTESLKEARNRKARGLDNINTELWNTAASYRT
ncbi:hypothetical protein ILUMI_07483 [Ignelater luminosus]|uniref:Uncharacterized protein n=1 Tax=Ignelater luminosus TaxID=2038154 RepID=A0A8K0GI09_IGNLU|nr:hypothetical protein ILUMI_07483 [Ignelater luminosus]